MPSKPWFWLIVPLLLAGCTIPTFTNHPAPDLKVDFSPFENAGCPLDESGYMRKCTPDSILYNLGCDRIEEAPASLGGLDPAYPIAVCLYIPMQHPEVSDPHNFPADEYFFNVGGSRLEVVRYIISVDGEFRLIHNVEEFQSVFAPVESPEEALGFTAALTETFPFYDLKYEFQYSYSVDAIDDTFVETTADGYLVHVFDYQFFGCGPHNYYAVDLNVTPEGKVEEIKRTPIFRDPKKDDLCQD